MKIFEGYQKRVVRFFYTPGERHVVAAALVLGISTIIWSSKIAQLQQGNADQLADGFLFTNAATFSQAQFPAAHTQLLKWPLFWLIGKLHSTPQVYMVATVGLCVLTIGGLAYLLFRIVRRPAMLGTLYLGLGCALTLVPAQVLGNVASPLSMAMVTGRNIEYLLYIAALVLLIYSKSKYDWYKWGLAAILLGLLFASDQLFLLCSVGGAMVLLGYAYGWKRRLLESLSILWLAVSGLGWVLAKLFVWVAGHFTQIVGTPTDFNGYATGFTSLKNAAVSGMQGVLLNFGVSLSAGQLAILSALLNYLLLIFILYASYRITRKVVDSSAQPDRSTLLSLLLGLSAAVVFIIYVAANHQVTADARYLTIAFFAGFVALAVYCRAMQVSDNALYISGVVFGIGILLGLVAVVHRADRVLATDPIQERNMQVAQILGQYHEQILMGDFWRVLPIREQTKQAGQQILPLSGCLRPRQILTSGAWRQSLYSHSFAYLVPLQATSASFGRCSFQAAVMLYGLPGTVVRIGGSQRTPAELLLLYNDGAARIRGKTAGVPTPVFGVPTEGTAKPTGSTIVPLADPS